MKSNGLRFENLAMRQAAMAAQRPYATATNPARHQTARYYKYSNIQVSMFRAPKGRFFVVEQTQTPQPIDQAKRTYVTLTFDHPLTNEEVAQIQLHHRAISAAYTVDLTSRPDWYHVDNGFTSRLAMDAQHGPLVDLARACLVGVPGRVFDLGCGNGALLKKICRDREDLFPYGVDSNVVAVEHARHLLPQFIQNFERRDIFDPLIWTGNKRYALAILMAGKLTQVSSSKATALLTCLAAKCDSLLLYVYPSWNGKSLETIIRQLGLRFERSIAGVAGIVAGTRPSPVPNP
jgi:hypothetical protein